MKAFNLTNKRSPNGKGDYTDIEAGLRYVCDMDRTEAMAKLKRTEPALRGLGVAGLYLFGSTARDEAAANSDVDVFVDAAAGAPFGFLPFMEAYDTVRQAIGENVSLGYSTREGLDPYIRAEAERQAIRIF
jgi:uncharacterized protein